MAYLERNNFFNFDKPLLGYLKIFYGFISTVHLFPKQLSQIEKFLINLGNTQTTLLAQVRQFRAFIVRVIGGYWVEENSEEIFSESAINAFDFIPPPTRTDRGHLIWQHKTEISCSTSWDILVRKSADCRSNVSLCNVEGTKPLIWQIFSSSGNEWFW